MVNLRSLDALRGMLATYVMLGHARWLLWTGHASWISSPHPAWQNVLAYASAFFRYGHEAVMVFFVLSGFFIHLRGAQQLAKGESLSFDAAKYFQRRANRLVPPYALALVLTLVLDLMGRHFFPTLYHAATGDPLLDDTFSRKNFSMAAVLPALLLLPSSAGLHFGSNGPLWSLGYEMIYYLLYPAWLSLRRRSAGLAYAGGLLVGVLAAALVPHGFPSIVLQHWPIWLAGAALSEIVCRHSPGRRVTLGAGLVVVAVAVSLHFHPASPVLLALYLIGGVSMVLVFADLPESVCQWKVHQGFEALGLRSYTIYICHFPVLTLISAWSIDRLGGRPTHGWLAVLGVAVALVVSLSCFKFCERRFLHPRLKSDPVLVVASGV